MKLHEHSWLDGTAQQPMVARLVSAISRAIWQNLAPAVTSTLH